MERLEFENYEEFACEIVDTFDLLEDEFGEVSIIAKYKEAKEIIRELLCTGYNVASIDIHNELWENYYDEYIISLNFDGVWCEKFKRDTSYLTDESNVFYIMDNCSSNVIPYCKSKKLYEVCIDESDNFENEESKTEHTYTVNGESVDKETFDAYVSKFDPDLASSKKEKIDDDNYSISVKCNLDADEALVIIKDMEQRITHMSDMFREMRCFSHYL